MNLKPELKGSTIYIKDLDRNIEVSEENIDLLKSVKAPVFVEEPQKDDNNKSRNSKRSLPDTE